MTFLRRLGISLVTLWIGFQATAYGQDIEEAKRLYLEPDFENATRVLDLILGKPNLAVQEAADAHAYLATIKFIFGDIPSAQQHATAAAALNPNVTLPDGAPDEVKTLFRSARLNTGGRPGRLSITTPTPLRRGSKGEIQVRLDPAPEVLVSIFEVKCTARNKVVQQKSGPPPVLSIEVRARDPLHCEAEAKTAAGAVLFRASENLPVLEPLPVGGTARESKPVWPWIVAGAGVAVVAAVVATVLATQSKASDASFQPAVVEGW